MWSAGWFTRHPGRPKRSKIRSMTRSFDPQVFESGFQVTKFLFAEP